MSLTFFDMFAGVGGFRLGMEKAGHVCIGSCEWDKYARETYKRGFGHYPEYDDAKNMSLASLPHFDVLCAGFPCQAFSIAGKRRGFKDTRGTVFFEIARIARESKPSYLFLENVKGLLSHDEGRTFSTIISTLDEMGYDAEWQVLNSKYFVPQNRERIFIIGHLRGERTRQIFPLGDLSKKSNRKIKKAGQLTLHDGTGFTTSGVSPTLISSEGSGSIIKIIDGRQGYRVYNVKGINQTLNANAGGFGAKMGLIGVRPQKGEWKPYDKSTCIDANYYKGCDSRGARTMIASGMRIRRLTPIECERLQGFPDNWTKGVSDTQRYRQMGNAVTVDVVEYLAKHLKIY